MKKIPLEWHERARLSNHICKLIDKLIRNEDNMNNIIFRVDLLNIQKCAEEILEKYKDKY